MLCRLCTVGDNDCRNLEGAVCDMLRAVLRKKYVNIENPAICSSCDKKVEKAFEFRTVCLRTQKILSLYGGSNNKFVYVRDNKLCVSSKNDVSVELCRICLRLIENGFCSKLVRKYDIIEMLSMYVPEMVIDDTEMSLICYKCSDHYRIFSEVINTANKTERMILEYCKECNIESTEQISLEDVIRSKPDSGNKNENLNLIKLLGGEDHFLLDLENEFESADLYDDMEDSKKQIIKKIIEEDVDLFYKEKPDFDLNDTFSEESGIDSDHGNIFFGAQTGQLLLSGMDMESQNKKIRHSIEEEPSMRLSFETEEPSLSPDGLISERNFYECFGQDEEKKDDREVTSPNPFIFIHYDQRCSCDEGEDVGQQKNKKKWCEKCKWKNALSYNYESTDSNQNSDELAVKKPKKDGKKKCRKAYGIEFKDMWCTQCRWKKACTRFGNSKAVSRR